MSAAKSNLETMRVLIEGGADVQSIDGQGYTPMIGAIGVLDYEKVHLLHERGATINVRNGSNLVTSLMASVTGSHMTLVKLCLANGCNVNDRDKAPMHSLQH